jgi:hypothetical protein
VRLRVLVPTYSGEAPGTPLAAGITSFEGKTIGFIDNGKFGVGRFADELEEMLRTRHGVARVIRERKGIGRQISPVLREVLMKCDAVICGVGD